MYKRPSFLLRVGKLLIGLSNFPSTTKCRKVGDNFITTIITIASRELTVLVLFDPYPSIPELNYKPLLLLWLMVWAEEDGKEMRDWHANGGIISATLSIRLHVAKEKGNVKNTMKNAETIIWRISGNFCHIHGIFIKNSVTWITPFVFNLVKGIRNWLLIRLASVCSFLLVQ